MKMNSNSFGFTPAEVRKLRRLKNPYGIQKLLDDMPYHLEDTAWSPRKVLAEQSSHCLEGAIFAAAALRVNGYPPLLLDFEADHDTDHVIAVYRQDGCWGAVAKSNYTGCRWREPVYRTLRELALSYFNIYFNLRRERTLRRYSLPVNLKRFDSQNWMTTDQPVWFIVYHLFDIVITREGRRLARDLFPALDDIRGAWQNLSYYLGLTSQKPEFARFNYAEKAEYWALVWGMFVMAGTGIMLWAKVIVGNRLPRWWLDIATAIHLYEAILATLAIVVWHFYQVFFDPDVYPMNWAWWDGKMTLHHYREEHGLDETPVLEVAPGADASEPAPEAESETVEVKHG